MLHYHLIMCIKYRKDRDAPGTADKHCASRKMTSIPHLQILHEKEQSTSATFPKTGISRIDNRVCIKFCDSYLSDLN